MAPSFSVPSMIMEEEDRFEAEVAEVQAWWNSERFKLMRRPYSARDVVALRGNLRQSYGLNEMAKKLWRTLKTHQANGTASRAFGALDPVQVAMMAKHLDTIYVSGWQCSSTHTTTNEPGPDLADYPYDTVPNKPTVIPDLVVPQQLSSFVSFSWSVVLRVSTSRTSPLLPKNAVTWPEKVLVAVSEHINRLVAARLQFDIMGVETVLVARTDAVAANLIQTNVDTRDHQFILGVTNPNLRGKPLATLLAEAIAAGKTEAELQAIEDNWIAAAQLKTFSEHVVAAIKNMNIGEHEKRKRLNQWMNHSRTREGFDRFKGSVMAAIVRGWAFASHSDLIWMETSTPDVVECTQFAEGVKSKHPEIMLAYNLSPSFNWDASGMTDEQMKEFIPKIARMGYCWQFITLGGFHADALVTDTFAKDFARRGMLAYVERIQREERDNEVDTLAHQKWSGANYYDRYLKTVQGGISSTAAMGKGVTEEQFKETWTTPAAMNMGAGTGSLVIAKPRM
ncbi:hypothetical protein SLA2020_027220 [Shorea laevis]